MHTERKVAGTHRTHDSTIESGASQTERVGQSGADTIPAGLTAEIVVRTHAGLSGLIGAPGRTIRNTAVAGAGAAEIRFGRTLLIPVHDAADEVEIADALGDGGVIATRGRSLHATIP